MFLPSEKRVLIRPDEKEKVTASGIVIPDTVREERPVTGVIIVGSGAFKENSRVLYSKYGVDEFDLDGEKLCVVHESNILGTF